MNVPLSEEIQKLAEARNELIAELRTHATGLAWCERHTAIADAAVTAVYRSILGQHPNLPPLAVIATGGYGRQEMSPYSDIDMTVVPLEEESAALDDAIRGIFQELHWAFGTVLRMEVGYSYRLISDVPGIDAKTRTGLMDARLICGSNDLFQDLRQALHEHFEAGEFILSKITEREEAHLKYHDTPLVTEPHLKEGAGGLRSFQCANWLRIASGERPRQATRAMDEVLKIRNLLHLVGDRRLDTFSRGRQSEVAEILGVDPLDMMSHFADAALALYHEYETAKERLHESRFPLSSAVMAVRGEARILGYAEAGEASVGIAIATRLGLQVPDLQPPCQALTNGPAALFAVSNGEKTLRNLDRAGLLATLVPELTVCRTQFSDDSVHSYTVFEHTLRVVRNLDSLAPGDFLGDLKDSLIDLEPVYLAALLHDVGKIDPEQNHSDFGAIIARRIGERWGLASGTIDLVEWLVKEHLTMARFIRIRDIQNPSTVREFANLIGSSEKLNFLTLLTWADVNAVAPTAWTPAQNTFLRELHRATAELLDSGDEFNPDPNIYRQRLLRQLRSEETTDEEVDQFVQSLPAHYLTSTPPDLVRLHLKFARKARRGEPTVEVFQRPELGATDLTVCVLDAPGLLSKVLGVFYAYDLSMAGIRACTTSTEPAVALDVFTLSFGGRPVPAATLRQVSTMVQKVLAGEENVEDVLRKRGKDPERQQEVFRHVLIPGSPAILEVRSPRGRGMAYRFSRLIAAQGWNIVAARFGQWAGNAAAAFYLQSSKGEITPDDVERALAHVP